MEIRRSHVHREHEYNVLADDNNASAEFAAFVSAFDVAFPEDNSTALQSVSLRGIPSRSRRVLRLLTPLVISTREIRKIGVDTDDNRVIT